MRTGARSDFNENGFSLINMVVGLGIGGIVMISFMTAVQMMNRSKKTTDVKSEASNFIDQLQSATLKATACATNLAGSNFVPDGTGGETEITFGNVFEGKDLGGGATVTRLRLKLSNIPSVTVPGSNLRSVSGRIEVQVANTWVTPPLYLRSRFVPVQVTYDATTKQIKGCGSIDSSAKVCEQLDGIWDPTAPKGLECTPTDKCLYGGAWSAAPVGGVDGNGSPNPGFINTFTGGKSCPNGFSAQQTGTVSVARKASKYQVVTDTYGNYTCVRCSAPVANQANQNALLSGVNLDPSGEGYADTETSDAKGDSFTSDIKSIWQKLGGAVP